LAAFGLKYLAEIKTILKRKQAGGHSTGKGRPVGAGRAEGGDRPAGGDPVRGLGRTAGGVRVGGGGRPAGCDPVQGPRPPHFPPPRSHVSWARLVVFQAAADATPSPVTYFCVFLVLTPTYGRYFLKYYSTGGLVR